MQTIALILLLLLSSIRLHAQAAGAFTFSDLNFVGGEPATATFSPADISGLAVWLKAHTMTNTIAEDGAVDIWTDSSGNNFNATQGSSGSRPIIKNNIINGYPIVRFDGSDDSLVNTNVSFGTVLIVAKYRSIASFKSIIGARLVGTTNAYDAFVGSFSTTTFGIRWMDGASADQTSSTIAVDTTYVLVVNASATTLKGRVNGTDLSTTTGVYFTNLIDRTVFGGAYHNDSVVDHAAIDVAEVIIFNRELTDVERIDCEYYLATKYGVIYPSLVFDSIALNNNGGAMGTVTADLDLDGDEEFITAASSDSADPHLKILFWNGTSVSSTNIIPTATVGGMKNRFGTELVAGRIDSDTYPDVAVIDSWNGGNDGALFWYKNPGANAMIGGTWTSNHVYTWSGSGARAGGNQIAHAELYLADLDNNGSLDIVSRDTQNGTWIHTQTGTAGTAWNTPQFLLTNPREGLALADISNPLDGRPDIILNGIWYETPATPHSGTFVSNNIVGATLWHPADNSGTSINQYAAKIEVADFNGDGKIDLAFASAEMLNGDANTKPLGVHVYLQPTDPYTGTWTNITLFATLQQWHTMTVGDVDNDGDIDAISGISSVGQGGAASQVYLFRNDGTGTSFVQELFSTSQTLYSGLFGDIDGDGDLDFLAPVNWNSGAVNLYRNITQ